MKKAILILLAAAGLATTAFVTAKVAQQPAAEQQEATASLPRLLERKAGLGSADERALVAGRFDQSMATLKTNPNDAKALLTLAEVYMNEARVTGEHPYYYPAALQALDKVLLTTQGNTDHLYQALYMKASVQLSLHHFQDALNTGNQAARINPYDAGIFGVLVDAHTELGQYAQAVAASDKMVSIRPDLRSYARISYLREIHGEVQGAFDALHMAVDAGYPGYEQTAWCRVTLGQLYERYGELDQAERQYRITLEERPGFPFATEGLASVQAKRGNNQAAIQLLDEATALIPEVSFTVMKAGILAEQGDTNAARKLALDAVDMMAEDAAKGHNMGLELAKLHLDLLHDLPKALQYATEEHAARPGNIDVNKVLAQIHLQMGNIQSARKHIDVATATKTQDPETLALQGLILAKEGDAAKGKALVQQALAKDPYLGGELASAARAIL